jgi:ubiquinone/menaquinone biosynthesis C-methylase UbiE
LPDFEVFVKKKFNTVYRAHYRLWVLWWPVWRSLYTGGNILKKWNKIELVRQGQTFLDYGCGTGTFTLPAARIVGAKGKVYALDCFERQLEMVKDKSQKEGLTNIATILSDNGTGLPDASVDVVWMGDVLHEIPDRYAVIKEMHRILKKRGTLAIYDGMKERTLTYTDGLFKLTNKDGKLLKFVK